MAGRKAMIDRKHRLSVTRQAQLLGLSRGAVYYLPQPVGAADLALMRRLDELHLEHPFVGARMLRRQLQSVGLQVERRHVRTLMLRMGMEALCPQPGTSKRHPDHQIYPYLLRHLAITRANPPCTRHFHALRRRIGIMMDSLAERSEFELEGDFC